MSLTYYLSAGAVTTRSRAKALAAMKEVDVKLEGSSNEAEHEADPKPIAANELQTTDTQAPLHRTQSAPPVLSSIATSSGAGASGKRHAVKEWLRGDQGQGQFGISADRWDSANEDKVAAADLLIRCGVAAERSMEVFK